MRLTAIRTSSGLRAHAKAWRHAVQGVFSMSFILTRKEDVSDRSGCAAACRAGMYGMPWDPVLSYPMSPMGLEQRGDRERRGEAAVRIAIPGNTVASTRVGLPLRSAGFPIRVSASVCSVPNQDAN